MKPSTKLTLDNETIAAIVREAVDTRHMSLSEIASLAGLSVTTPARIYHGDKNQVQMKTARKIAEALGYEVQTSASGKVSFEKSSDETGIRRLTPMQKERIVKAVEIAIRKELERF